LRERTGKEAPSCPRLHVGSAVSTGSTAAEGRFHKLHNTTGILSSQQIIRFAIEELRVPVRPGLTGEGVLAELNRAIGDA
jgi:hypothetical protein